MQSLIHKAVRTPTTVLVAGQPGTGKRTVAEILNHYRGNDAVEQPTLDQIRSGAFTDGAYLHPVEALTLVEQWSLSQRITSMDLCVVLATRVDLDSEAAVARLHPDLLAACGVAIRLPTLSERIEDLEALALHILCNTPAQSPIGGISDPALECLRLQPWEGNVSELEQVLCQALEVGRGEQVELRDLPLSARLRGAESPTEADADLEFSLAHAERSAIERALRFARGNKRKAARLLKIGKTTLYRKLRGYEAEAEAELDAALDSD